MSQNSTLFGSAESQRGLPTVRVMRRSDLEFADTLRAMAGWNQTLRDWERFLACDPEGCFLAEWSGSPAGTATTTCYGPHLAWVGMLLVHPDRRRQGIGSALLERCIRHLTETRGVRCIKLDATPLGQPVYERRGFQSELTLARWERAGSLGPGTSPPVPHHTATGADLDLVSILDQEAFGCRRCSLLEQLAQQSCWVAQTGADAGKAVGFGFLRPGSRAHYLGPIVATNSQTAHEIISELLGPIPDRPVYWDILDLNTPAQELALGLGFRKQRPLVRMFLGHNPGPGNTYWQWGIAGPATG